VHPSPSFLGVHPGAKPKNAMQNKYNLIIKKV
jgi:hypothetical protein